jgi:hypothetical protein
MVSEKPLLNLKTGWKYLMPFGPLEPASQTVTDTSNKIMHLDF